MKVAAMRRKESEPAFPSLELNADGIPADRNVEEMLWRAAAVVYDYWPLMVHARLDLATVRCPTSHATVYEGLLELATSKSRVRFYTPLESDLPTLILGLFRTAARWFEQDAARCGDTTSQAPASERPRKNAHLVRGPP